MGGTLESTGIKFVLPGYQKFRGTMGGTQVSKFPRSVDFDVEEDEDKWVTPQWQPGYQNVTGPNGWYPGIKIDGLLLMVKSGDILRTLVQSSGFGIIQ